MSIKGWLIHNYYILKGRLRFLFCVYLPNIIYFYKNLFLPTKGQYEIINLNAELKIKARRNTIDEIVINQVWFDKAYPLPRDVIKNGEVVMDIGAHIGSFSLFAAYNTPCTVYAFEPFIPNFKLLKENIKLNSMQTRIIPHNIAISDTIRHADFFLGGKNTGEGSMVIKVGKRSRINTLTLEKFFKDQDIKICDLMKIDAEGEEYSILYGLDDSIFDKINNILMETHILNKNEEYTISGLESFLQKKGFRTVISARDYLYAYKS